MKLNFASLARAIALAGAIFTFGISGNQAYAQAQEATTSPVTLRSDVKIERTEIDANGNEKTMFYTPKDVAVVPGDKVVFNLVVHNIGAKPALDFVATNPMPAAVRFTSVTEEWAEVSVDGGISYGKLADLKVKTKGAEGPAEVERAATAEDVTHVRWIFADAIAAGTQRTVSYRGVVK